MDLPTRLSERIQNILADLKSDLLSPKLVESWRWIYVMTLGKIMFTKASQWVTELRTQGGSGKGVKARLVSRGPAHFKETTNSPKTFPTSKNQNKLRHEKHLDDICQTYP